MPLWLGTGYVRREAIGVKPSSKSCLSTQAYVLMQVTFWPAVVVVASVSLEVFQDSQLFQIFLCASTLRFHEDACLVYAGNACEGNSLAPISSPYLRQAKPYVPSRIIN